MKFEIISSEQTPKVSDNDLFDADYLEANKNIFNEFLIFASQQSNAVGLAANQCSLNGEKI